MIPGAALAAIDVRSRVRRSPGAAIGVVALVALAGALAAGGASAARRTAGGYGQMLRDIDAPDLLVGFACVDDGLGGCHEATLAGPDPLVELARHPSVDRLGTVVHLVPVLETLGGANPAVAPGNATGCIDRERGPAVLASRPGAPSDQQIPFRLDGTMPEPGSTQVVLSRVTAERVGVGAGDTILLKGWCASADDEGTQVLLDAPVRLTISGLAVGPLDIEPPGEGFTVEPLFIDPAVFAKLADAGASVDESAALWLAPGASPETVPDFDGQDGDFDQVSVIFDLNERRRIVDDALAVDARLLWAFAGIILGVAALVLIPIVARHVRDSAPNPSTLAALGASGRQRGALTVGYAGGLAATGAVVGVALAALVSPRLPRGLGDAVEPSPGPWIDPVVSLLIIAVVVGGSMVIAAMGSWLPGVRPRPSLRRRQPRAGARVAARLRLAPPEDTGIRAALGATASTPANAPWAVLLVVALTVSVVAASGTFLASLRYLERSPRLVGFNWDGIVDLDDDIGDIEDLMATVRSTDGVVVATRGTLYPPVFLLEPVTQTSVWPYSFDSGPGAIGPTMTSGRAAAGPEEIVVDVVMARQLDLKPGDTLDLVRFHLAQQVVENLGFEGITIPPVELEPVPLSFTVTGIAVLPRAFSGPLPQAALTLAGMQQIVTPRDGELEAALAVVPDDAPAAVHAEVQRRLTAPIGREDVYVRIQGDRQVLADSLAVVDGVEEVILPAPEAVVTNFTGLNLTRTDRVPRLLAGSLSVLGVVVLAYLTATAVVARRGELARLRSLGFRRTDALRSSVAQGGAATVVMVAIGAGIGVAVGRSIWSTYARDLDLVAEPVIPWRGIGLGSAVALGVAGIVSVVSARLVTRGQPASHLRSE